MLQVLRQDENVRLLVFITLILRDNQLERECVTAIDDQGKRVIYNLWSYMTFF